LKLISSQINLGNKFPHLNLYRDKCIQLGIQIAKQNKTSIYKYFLDPSNLETPEMERLVFFLSCVPIDINTYKSLWVFYYKQFQSIAEDECSKFQLLILKILTKLVCMMVIQRCHSSNLP
jgi:hypothetical protein